MSRPRPITDEDLRTDCANLVRGLTALGVRFAPDPAGDDWWTADMPPRAAGICRRELALAALLDGKGCGVHARSAGRGQPGQRARFGSRRLNEAFVRAVREADAAGARS